MELFQIRYFLAVAEDLNFTRAAERCNVSQPSLSRAIKNLEEELGGDLFRRERIQTHLTNLGRSMLPLLRQSHDCALAAKAQAGNFASADHAPLRIGMSLTVDICLVAPMLTELARTFPGLQLHFVRGVATHVLGALKAGDIDIAIVADAPLDWDRFTCWPLFNEGFVLVTAKGHLMARRRKLSLQEIAGESVIARPYCESSAAFMSMLADHDITLRRPHEAASDSDVAALVASGLGLSIMPSSTGRAASVTAVPIVDTDFVRTVQAIGVAGRQQSMAAGNFIRLLRAADWSETEAETQSV